MMANALRVVFQQAMETVVKKCRLHSYQFTGACGMGFSQEEALLHLGERVKVKIRYGYQRDYYTKQVGGNLAQILDNETPCVTARIKQVRA